MYAGCVILHTDSVEIDFMTEMRDGFAKEK